MNSAICAAIAARAVIELSYDDGSVRVVEPHLHGTGPDGAELLHAYQVSGYSTSGRSTGWKLFKVERIAALRMTEARFLENRPDYMAADKRLSSVHCCV